MSGSQGLDGDKEAISFSVPAALFPPLRARPAALNTAALSVSSVQTVQVPGRPRARTEAY